jgi:glycosyltransferase involved in cell wall biosynthesis
MSYTDLITVGVPTYNRPDGLKHTLDCLLKQTYRNLRIMVSDNCSVNQKVIDEIVNEYSKKDLSIEFFRQEKNIGAIKNLMFLLNKAESEFFMWAADDDEFDETFVEELSKALIAQPEAAVAISGVTVTDQMTDTPITINLTPHLKKLSGKTAFERLSNHITQPVEQGSARILWGLCRRETLSKAVESVVRQSKKDEILWIDFPVDLEILKYGDVVVVPKELFHVYLLPTSDGLREGNTFNKKEVEMCKRSYQAYHNVVNHSELTKSQKQFLNKILSRKQSMDLIKIVPFYVIKRYAPWLARWLKKVYFALFVR